MFLVSIKAERLEKLQLMKLVLKNPDSFTDDKLIITSKDIPCLDASWHYHPQYELLYISQSTGIRFVGDSVSPFSPGDFVLVGSYLPHLWRNDPHYYKEGENGTVKTIVIKFLVDFIAEGTFKNPVFSAIDSMLEQSKYGIDFGKEISKSLHADLTSIVDMSPAEQSIKLLGILHKLSAIEDRKVLSSTDMRQYAEETSHRIDTVLKFISDNYSEEITLQDIADIACMTTNSFCRYFKKMTNKSFVDFLNEIRIRNASRLLAQDDLPVSEVCYSVGYKSITNFNNQFKNIMGTNPKSYRVTIKGGVPNLNAIPGQSLYA